MRIKPKFGEANKNLNDVTINFSYQGQMICELQIKLGSGKGSLLYHSNHFIYEIERVCPSKDEYKLFEVYTKGMHFATNHHCTFDSNLLQAENARNFNEERYILELKNREVLTDYLPLFDKILQSRTTQTVY